MKNIVWLASYPKSGNTWFRAFLANLLHEKEDPADINRLGGGPIFSARSVFDNNTFVEASNLLPDEMDNLRPRVYDKLSDKAKETVFMKAHDAYTFLSNGEPLFPSRATKGAIYLLRNPLDIAPSFANHSARSIEDILPAMNDRNDFSCANPKNLADQLRQKLLGWSGHVESWLQAKEIDVHFVRYEDMKQKPLETFYQAIQFAGLSHGKEEVEEALKASSFENLKKQENEKGFLEKHARAKSFFRKGEVGSWRESLSKEQVKTLIQNHEAVMRRFGYLDANNCPVF